MVDVSQFGDFPHNRDLSGKTAQDPAFWGTKSAVLRLADNKMAQGAGWDLDLLRLELKEIEVAGYDVELTGFNMGEIDALRVIGDPGTSDLT